MKIKTTLTPTKGAKKKKTVYFKTNKTRGKIPMVRKPKHFVAGEGARNIECPLYIIEHYNTLNESRYELIYKRGFICLSAQSSLESLFRALNNILSVCGYSIDSLINYIDKGVINSEHGFKPCPTMLEFRKQTINNKYDDILIGIIENPRNNYK